MAIVEEELTKLSQQIVQEIVSLGGSAISLSGKDCLIEVKKHADIEGQDMGYVGEITKINGDAIKKMIASGIIPVIAPLGASKKTPLCTTSMRIMLPQKSREP